MVQSADIGIQGHIPGVRVLDARGLTTRVFLEARQTGDWSAVDALYRDPTTRPHTILVLRLLPAWILDADLMELEPLPGLDPWLGRVEDPLPHYPLWEDLYFEEMGWRAVARIHRSGAEKPTVGERRARWKRLVERFPAHPWLRAQLAALEGRGR